MPKGFTKKAVREWPENHKACTKCKKIKPFKDFHKHSGCRFGINTVCLICRKPASKAHYKTKSKEYNLLCGAKSRAKIKKLDFSITINDINIPKICPVFNLPLTNIGWYSPTIDRINSNLGYTKENIIIISKRANTLKNNGTIKEFEDIIKFIKLMDK